MDLALNNLQRLICHKNKPNQTIQYIYLEKLSLYYPDMKVFIVMQTAYSFLAVIKAQETEKELVRVYEQRHPPPSVATLKGSVTDSTWLNWQLTPN